MNQRAQSPSQANHRKPAIAKRWGLLSSAVIVLAALAAYSNSFHGAMVFDDIPAIMENPTVRSLHSLPDLRTVLAGPNGGETTTGRPLINLSVAINVALNGEDTFGYHILNFVVHVIAALAFFGLVRRTLLLPSVPQQLHRAAAPLAMLTALLWAIHPLQTESVTYIIQRAESIMGMFFLLTLYCFLRGATGTHKVPWFAVAVVCCAAGMASKEVMVVCPLIALLYDRIFLSGSWRETLRRRWPVHVCLLATWGVLLAAILPTLERGGTALIEIRGTRWDYAATQLGVIVEYLRLIVWPNPSDLCLDHFWPIAKTAQEILLPGCVIAVLLALTVWALVRRPALGFLGVWFFLILAPTSSFLPIADMMFEHRVYLSLAAIAALVIIGGYLLLAKFTKLQQPAGEPPPTALGGRMARHELIAAIFAVAIVAALGFLTWQRNKDYATHEIMLADMCRKAPTNPRAWVGYGMVLQDHAKYVQAEEAYKKSLSLNDAYRHAHYHFAELRIAMDQKVDGLVAADTRIPPDQKQQVAMTYHLAYAKDIYTHLKRAVELSEERHVAYARAHAALAIFLAIHGQMDDAAHEAQIAIEQKTQAPEPYRILADVLVSRAKDAAASDRVTMLEKAAESYARAWELRPRQTTYDMSASVAAKGAGDVLMQLKRPEQAAQWYKRSADSRPPARP